MQKYFAKLTGWGFDYIIHEIYFFSHNKTTLAYNTKKNYKKFYNKRL